MRQCDGLLWGETVEPGNVRSKSGSLGGQLLGPGLLPSCVHMHIVKSLVAGANASIGNACPRLQLYWPQFGPRVVRGLIPDLMTTVHSRAVKN